MATYYISPSGNDSTGTGTIGNPWQTPSKACTSGTTGDTVIALAGTYTLTTLGWNKNIILQGQLDANYKVATKFNFQGLNLANSLFGGSGDHFIYNIWFYNINTTTLGSNLYGQLRVQSSGCTSITFENCIFSNIATGYNSAAYGELGAFLSTDSYSTNVFLRNCLITKIGGISTKASLGSNFIGGTNQAANRKVAAINCTFDVSNPSIVGVSQLDILFGYRRIGTAGVQQTHLRNCCLYNTGSSVYVDYASTVGSYTQNYNYTDNCINGSWLYHSTTPTNVKTSAPVFFEVNFSTEVFDYRPVPLTSNPIYLSGDSTATI